MPTVALILGRGASKGIPMKNLAKVGGVSLLARALEAAWQSEIFSHVLVSTDHELLAAEARRYGAQVVLRPAVLATDTASSISAALHALETVGIQTGCCCLLQPTSPLRTATHVRQSHVLWQEKTSGSVVSACEAEHHPYKCFVQTADGLSPVHAKEMLEMPRQQLPTSYRPNGAIYWNRIEQLFAHQSFFIDPVRFYLMTKRESVDVDKPEDLMFANFLYQNHPT